MDLLSNLLFGFSIAVSLQNLAYCFIGVLVGTLIGVLPGIGPLATIAMLLPLTFNVGPVGALIMLAGIYYGAQYGGSTTAILVNLPGETSSVVTCIDGYQMARQGRAGPALAIAAIGSFFAGTVGTLLIALFGPPLADFALKFGAPEYFSLMLMGLVAAAVLAEGDMIRSLAMVGMGLLLGIVGSDVNTGVPRFSFGITELTDGIGFVVVAVGVFAVGEIINNLGDATERQVFTSAIKSLMPTKEDLKASFGPILRGTGLGAFFGVLPGTGPAVASLSSYMLEKKLAADDLTGSVLAATLEPCTSRGTHTPCCDHIIRRGIAQVLVGSLDPNPRIRGLGYRKLVDNGVSVEFFPTDARKTVADENRHFIESFNQSQTLSGTVTFDYIATGGDFPLGNGENEFLTHWSNRGNGSVYCYPSHTLRAAIVPHRNIAEIESAAAWLEGVKGHVEPSEGEIVVLENSYGRFAAIKILKVRERQPGVQNALLQFDYQITSHPEGDFRPH